MLAVEGGTSFKKIGVSLFSVDESPFQRFEGISFAGEGFTRLKSETEKKDAEIVSAQPGFQQSLESILLIPQPGSEGLEKDILAESFQRSQNGASAATPSFSNAAFRTSRAYLAVPFDTAYLLMPARPVVQDNAPAIELQSTAFSLQPDYGRGIRYALYVQQDSGISYADSVAYHPQLHVSAEIASPYIPHHIRWILDGRGWYGAEHIDRLRETIPHYGSRSGSVTPKHLRASNSQPTELYRPKAENYTSFEAPAFVLVEPTPIPQQKAYLSVSSDINPIEIFVVPSTTKEAKTELYAKQNEVRLGEINALLQSVQPKTENHSYDFRTHESNVQYNVKGTNSSVLQQPYAPQNNAPKLYAQERTPELKLDSYKFFTPEQVSYKIAEQSSPKEHNRIKYSTNMPSSAEYMQLRPLKIDFTSISADTKASDYLKISNLKPYVFSVDSVVEERLPANYRLETRNDTRYEDRNVEQEKPETEKYARERAERYESKREEAVEEKAEERYESKKHAQKEVQAEEPSVKKDSSLEKRLGEGKRNNGKEPEKNYDNRSDNYGSTIAKAGVFAGGLAVAALATAGTKLVEWYQNRKESSASYGPIVVAPVVAPGKTEELSDKLNIKEDLSLGGLELGLRIAYDKNGKEIVGARDLIKYRVTAEDIQDEAYTLSSKIFDSKLGEHMDYSTAGNSALAVLDRLIQRAGLQAEYELQYFANTETGKMEKGIIVKNIGGFKQEAERIFGKQYGDKASMFIYRVNSEEPVEGPDKQIPIEKMGLKTGDDLNLLAIAQGTYASEDSKSLHEVPREKEDEQTRTLQEGKDYPCNKSNYPFFHAENMVKPEELKTSGKMHEKEGFVEMYEFSANKFLPKQANISSEYRLHVFNDGKKGPDNKPMGFLSSDQKGVRSDSYAALIDWYLVKNEIIPFWREENGQLKLKAIPHYHHAVKKALGTSTDETELKVLLNGREITPDKLMDTYRPETMDDKVEIKYVNKNKFKGLEPKENAPLYTPASTASK